MIAIATKTKDVYSFVTDRHDIFADIDPLSGKSLLTVSPIGKRNLITQEVGKFEGRDYKKEAEQALVDIEKYKIDLDKNKIVISSKKRSKVKPMEAELLGVSAKTFVTKDKLDAIANSKNI